MESALDTILASLTPDTRQHKEIFIGICFEELFKYRW